jgi:hypothetical protein
MEGNEGWSRSVERIEEAFERGEAEVLAALLRGARRSRLPPIPDAARRLLVIQGLERAERCAAAGHLALARTEFARAVARAAAPGEEAGPRAVRLVEAAARG